MAISSISPVGVFGVGSISPTTLLFPVLATQELAAFDSSSTIVSLSGFGQMLSTISAFQSNLALLPLLANAGSGENFGSLTAVAQNFVDSFNTLQSNLDNLRGQLGILPGELLTAQLVQALDQQASAVFDNGNSTLTTLAQIGIDLQASPIPGNGATLSIDLQALQSAFNADPAGSFSLLAGAAQAMGEFAAGFESQAAGAAASLALQSASLFSSGLFSSGLTTSGLQQTTDLLTLGLLSQGGIAGQAQSLAALNQFLLVSTLLA